MVITLSSLTYRTIDVDADADIVAANHLDACVSTFGHDRRYEGRTHYLAWLRRQVDEFPDGHVLAFEGAQCVGHLELQVPYGNTSAYINLYHVPAELRGKGYARRLHDYVDRYARSWEADRIALHVSPANRRALNFYRSMEYSFAGKEERGSLLWRMEKALSQAIDQR